MRKVYLDETKSSSCMSVFINDAEVIKAGATIYAMPVSDKNSEYQRYADEYDIHFIFEDNIPTIDFYTIPQVDIFAEDSDGGFIGSIGQMTDFQSDAVICYINKNRKCFFAAKDGKDFLQNVRQWKNSLMSCDDVEIFSSKEEAERKYEFLDKVELEQSIKEVERQ